MSLITPRTLLNERMSHEEKGDRSPSIRSILSPAINRAVRLQAGPSSIDIPMDLTDDEREFDDGASTKENYRFASKIIRKRYSRINSFQFPIIEHHSSDLSNRRADPLVIQAPPTKTLTVPGYRNSLQNISYAPPLDNNQTILFSTDSFSEFRGQTLLHLAARLGHDEILRLLICETSQASLLMNKKGQTPLLTAIEAGSTSTATLLMEADPRSIIASDNNGSSVFHYACEHCNDVVLHRAIALSKRLNSTSDRITVKIFFRLDCR